MKETNFLNMYLKWIFILSVIIKVKTADRDDLVKKAIHPGRCPHVKEQIFKNIKQHMGIWYATHTSIRSSDTKCSVTLVRPSRDGVDVYMKSLRSNGDEYRLHFPKTEVKGRPGLYTMKINIANKLEIPIITATVMLNPQTTMTWGCAILPHKSHIEYAVLYSKDLYMPEEYVTYFTNYLRDHGSRINRFSDIPTERCF